MARKRTTLNKASICNLLFTESRATEASNFFLRFSLLSEIHRGNVSIRGSILCQMALLARLIAMPTMTTLAHHANDPKLSRS